LSISSEFKTSSGRQLGRGVGLRPGSNAGSEVLDHVDGVLLEGGYPPGYYAAFVIDPDGNNIEAVFREA
jgi:hypothetical protein